MEVESHESQVQLWKDAHEFARRIFYERHDSELLDKADRVAEEFRDATGETWGRLRQRRDELAAAHFTEEQQRYAGRCYPRTPQANRGLPWPAPERVPDETIRSLASIVLDEPATSLTAWAAVRLLGVASIIEAARRADEVSRGSPSE